MYPMNLTLYYADDYGHHIPSGLLSNTRIVRVVKAWILELQLV